MSKIEKPQALEELEEILRLSDAVMVARGDLGVELPPEDVPLIQKRLIRAAHSWGRPVVVATQMMEHVRAASHQAEASDVATAVFDGAVAGALGGDRRQYPIETVRMMEGRVLTAPGDDDLLRAARAARTPKPEESSADHPSPSPRASRRGRRGQHHRRLHHQRRDRPARRPPAA